MCVFLRLQFSLGATVPGSPSQPAGHLLAPRVVPKLVLPGQAGATVPALSLARCLGEDYSLFLNYIFFTHNFREHLPCPRSRCGMKLEPRGFAIPQEQPMDCGKVGFPPIPLKGCSVWQVPAPGALLLPQPCSPHPLHLCSPRGPAWEQLGGG